MLDLTPTECGAFVVPLTAQFPPTDLEVLFQADGRGRKVTANVDTDDDGITDHSAACELAVRDVNNNGRIDRGADLMVIRVVTVTVIQRHVAFDFGPAERLAAARRVVRMLGGVPA